MALSKETLSLLTQLVEKQLTKPNALNNQEVCVQLKKCQKELYSENEKRTAFKTHLPDVSFSRRLKHNASKSLHHQNFPTYYP